jgi:hypothetical protein
MTIMQTHAVNNKSKTATNKVTNKKIAVVKIAVAKKAVKSIFKSPSKKRPPPLVSDDSSSDESGCALSGILDSYHEAHEDDCAGFNNSRYEAHSIYSQ